MATEGASVHAVEPDTKELFKFRLAQSGLLGHTIDDAAVQYDQANRASWGSDWETRGQNWYERSVLDNIVRVVRAFRASQDEERDLLMQAQAAISSCQRLDLAALAHELDTRFVRFQLAPAGHL